MSDDELNTLAGFVGKLLKVIVSRRDASVEKSLFDKEVIKSNLKISEQTIDGLSKITAELKPSFEYALFRSMFMEKANKSYYHYTSFENLFHILNNGMIQINALTGVNDRSEIDFVNNYMGKKPDNPYQYITMAYHNYHFIFSLSEAKDQLNQWRLYGDDAKGVMIEFETKSPEMPPENVLISKVSYDLNVFDAYKEWKEFIEESTTVSFNLVSMDYWKFFFKNQDYKDEMEVRLIIKNNKSAEHLEFEEKFKLNRYNLIFPYIELQCIGEKAEFLAVKSITLGPKILEPEVNIAQLQYLLSKKYPSLDIPVQRSRISHYR